MVLLRLGHDPNEARRLGGMRIRLSDTRLVPDLLAYLREHVHVTAAHIAPQEVEVSQLGSQHAAGRRLELALLLQVWRASHGNVEARILD